MVFHHSSRRLLRSCAVPFCLMFGFASGGCQSSQKTSPKGVPQSDTGCVHDGQDYAVGTQREDDCNTCTCEQDGNWACTEMACPSLPDGQGADGQPSADEGLAGGTRPRDEPGNERKPSPEGGDCGGMLGLGCQEGLFCRYSPQAQCGAADQTGTCEPPPEMCTQQYDPVCGCDGKTYSNACVANSESVSVASKGECGG